MEKQGLPVARLQIALTMPCAAQSLVVKGSGYPWTVHCGARGRWKVELGGDGKEASRVGSFRKSAWVESELAMDCAASSISVAVRNDAGFCRVARNGGDFKVETLTRLCEDGGLSDAVAALDLLRRRGARINLYVFYRVLKRCMSQRDLGLGRRIHALLVQSGYESNAFLANHVICLYASHGRLDEAIHVFKKVSAPSIHMWASIILAHARHGQPMQAIELYRQMRKSTVNPDNRVFVAVLRACAGAADLASGKEVHADILRSVHEPDVFVNSCLVDMYAKCGSLLEARSVFDNLPTKNMVTWTAMITGYAQHELGQEALALYASMQQEGFILADVVTLVGILQACASVGALGQGKQLHAQIEQRGLEANVVVGSSLVNMYAKCGNLGEARRVFDKLPAKDVVTWNALLNGHAHHSDSEMAFKCYNEMRLQGVRPDEATFTCLLVACSHGGLMNEGWKYLQMMVEEYDIVPSGYHRTCMIDLLGRSGCLDEAEQMLHDMPCENEVVGWRSLLSACKSHGDIERGRRCFDRLIAMEPSNAVPYVLLGNIYANAGRWEDVEVVESLRKVAGAKKKPGKACIEIRNKVHQFTVGEERADVSSKLGSLNFRLKQGGHVPHTELVLKAVSEQEKEDALCGHAEKLALAYGLLNTPDGTTLLVTKNLRMCNDCHSTTKIMSHLEKREIIVRDAHRVHSFVDGNCSCGDRH